MTFRNFDRGGACGGLRYRADRCRHRTNEMESAGGLSGRQLPQREPRAFAKDVAAGSGGKLEITVHPNASLFKAPEIKRAVQTGQAQIGEVLISLHENEDPVFGVDVVPFLATSFADAKKLWAASRPADREKARGARSGGSVRGAVAAAGHLRQKGSEHGRRHEGTEMAGLQRGHVTHRRHRWARSRSRSRRPSCRRRSRPEPSTRS